MSENSITPIRSVRPLDPGARAQVELASRLSASPRPEPAAPEQAPASAQSTPAQVSNMAEVALQFRIDDQTSKLTVFVVDRTSRRVLRSIPANELYKLQAGDLLKLTA